MTNIADLRVNAGRLQRRLHALAQIGRLEGGGVCRLAFSPEDRAGRDFVAGHLRAMGLAVRIDAIGNMLAVRSGTEAGPPVMTGSHVDTVATGGMFDGSLGVLAGLEVLETLQDAGIATRRPVALAVFVNEEGVRFMPDMMGSLSYCGHLSTEEVRTIVGTDGTTIGENLERTHYAGTDDWSAVVPHAFVELHVEQGPVLEAEGGVVAAVEGVQGISWTELTLRGTSNHAGTTPMSMRHDAGYVAAAIAHFARLLTEEIDGLRATAGSIRFSPNLVNVIAEAATLTVDLRHPDGARLAEAEERLLAYATAAAGREGIDLQHRSLARVDPVAFDAGVIDAIERAAGRLGHPARRMTSGAGHDAQIIGMHHPAAMIFVPSRGGISHNVREHTDPEHVEAGANVLLQAMLALASA